MNWISNLIASVCAAIAAATSAYFVTLFTLNIGEEISSINDLFSTDFIVFNAVSLCVVTPVAFLSGPRIVNKFDNYHDKLSYLIITIAGASFGVLLGLICMVILFFYFSGNLAED